MTEMNTPETKKLFTIAQAANACSVSRSTLLRMEEEGLLKPARHSDGRYRYYDVQNIMEAMQIYSMHRMGLTRSQIRPLIDTPEEIDGVIARLETMRNNLDAAITELKKRTLEDSSSVTELLQLPETLCYIKPYDLEGGRYDLGQYLQETIEEAIEAGCRFDWDRRPFMRVFREDLAEGVFRPGTYRYHVCIPVQRHPKALQDIALLKPRRILSVTWHGRVTDLSARTLTLTEDARAMGLKPTGWFHLIQLILNVPREEIDPQSSVLQLGCIVE